MSRTRTKPKPQRGGTVVELEITALAAGGDGLGRVDGLVTFVPYTAVGDRVRARVVEKKPAWARGELEEVIAASGDRAVPPCRLFAARACGGCQWQHVTREAQLAAKHAIVAGALRKPIAAGMELRPVLDPAPAYGWRRRARLHVDRGAVGFFAPRSHTVADLAGVGCAQLDPRLDRAVAAVRAAAPPDGELDVAIGHAGDVVIATRAAWPAAAGLVGTANIVGVDAGGTAFGTIEIELEPGLVAHASDFAQATDAGNAALIGEVVRAVGPASGTVLELYAGGGNFTRALAAGGWQITAADLVPPRRSIPGVRFLRGTAAEAIASVRGQWFAAVVLDPPRTGAADVARTLRELGPRIIYISCDPATLARDLDLIGGTPRWAQPLDLMPQTAHVEVVVLIE